MVHILMRIGIIAILISSALNTSAQITGEWKHVSDDDRNIANYPRVFQSRFFIDDSSNQLILFGKDVIFENTEVWSYDPTTLFWENIYSKKDWRDLEYQIYSYDSQRNQIYELTTGMTGFLFNIYDLQFNLMKTVQLPQEYTSPIPSRLLYLSSLDMIFIIEGLELSGIDQIPSNGSWLYDIKKSSFIKVPIANSFQGRLNPSLSIGNNNEILFYGGQYLESKGGITTTYSMNDTWIFNYDDISWTRIYPQVFPSSRSSASLIYDKVNQFYVLYGGTDNEQTFDDLWVFDPKTREWSTFDILDSPTSRFGSSMTFNENTKSSILYGGQDLNNKFFDVWELKINQEQKITTVTPSQSSENISSSSKDSLNLSPNLNIPRNQIFLGLSISLVIGLTVVYLKKKSF